MAPSLKSQTLSLFGGKVVAYLVMTLIPVILVRLLSPDQFGVYRQILFVYAVLLPIFRFQLPESLYYFYPRKKAQIDLYLSQTIALLFITGVAGSGLFILAGYTFHILPSGLTTKFVIPLAALLLIEAVASLIEHIFVLEKKPKLTIIANASFSLLRMMLVVGAVLIFGHAYAMVFALIIWGVVRLAVALIYMSRRYPLRIGFAGRKPMREQLKYALPLAIGGTIGLISAKIDKGIISGYMSPEDFALYTIGGLGIVSAVKLLYISIGNVFVPRFGELALKKNFNAIRLLWHRMILMNAVVTLPIVTFCCIFAEQIISILYTRQYIEASNLWRLNMLVLLIQLVGFGYIPKALGKTKAVFAGNLAHFAVSVPLSILLILHLRLIGGVIAFVIGFWVNGLVQLRVCKVSIGARLSELLPWSKLTMIAVICVIAGAVLPFFMTVQVNIVFQVLLGAAYYFPVIALLLVVCKIIDLDELAGVIWPARVPHRKSIRLRNRRA